MNPTERDLLLRSLDAELRPADERRLHLLLDRSDEARRELERMRALRRRVAHVRAEAFAPRFADRVMQAVADEPAVRSRPSILAWLEAHLLAPAPAAAWAVAVLLLMIGLAWWTWPRAVHVPPGSMRTVALADGTTVELSSGSELAYRPFEGRGVRKVVLTGEAFFDVAPNEKPFVIETFNAQVEVRGTRLNVRAWPEGSEPQTTVSLQAGAADVRALGGETAVALVPDETTVVPGLAVEPMPPVRVPLSQVMAWRTGGLAFRDRPLDTVVAELERRYGVEIRLTSADLSRLRIVYLDPDPGSLHDVLTAICAPQRMRFRETSRGFELLRNP